MCYLQFYPAYTFCIKRNNGYASYGRPFYTVEIVDFYLPSLSSLYILKE